MLCINANWVFWVLVSSGVEYPNTASEVGALKHDDIEAMSEKMSRSRHAADASSDNGDRFDRRHLGGNKNVGQDDQWIWRIQRITLWLTVTIMSGSSRNATVDYLCG